MDILNCIWLTLAIIDKLIDIIVKVVNIVISALTKKGNRD